jgi:hypothetical protein
MKTFKITFQIETPLAINFPYLPTFDGVLSYGYVKEIYRSENFRQKYLETITDDAHKEYIKSLPYTSFMPQKMSYSDEEMIQFHSLPIARKEYFLGSSMIIPETDNEFFGYVRKQWDKTRIQFSGHKKNIRINMGQTKSIQIEIPLKITPEVSFVFASKDLEMVKLLLSHVVAFGKKRNKQWGKIASYSIVETDYDWQVINRPIPERFVSVDMIMKSPKVITFYMAWEPPYHQSEKEICVIPNI